MGRLVKEHFEIILKTSVDHNGKGFETWVEVRCGKGTRIEKHGFVLPPSSNSNVCENAKICRPPQLETIAMGK